MKMTLFWVCALLTLSACALLERPAPPVQQWFHLSALDSVKISPEPSRTRLSIAKIQAPHWLLDGGLYYRLAYRDALNLQPYAQSRWVTPVPQQLLQNLRRYWIGSRHFVMTEAPGPGDYVLQLWLDDFCQIYLRPDHSHAALRAHATLLDAHQQVIAQNSWQLEIAASSANALGGAQALDQASHQLINILDQWVIENIK